jgi:hypothetical protein
MMTLSILAIVLSVLAISSNLMILLTIRVHQRHLDGLNAHLETCDRRLSRNHESIIDLYSRCNRIEMK